MATVTETFRKCDRTGRIKGVRMYSIEVKDDDSVAVWSRVSDLSPLALTGLKAALERATTMGPKRKVKAKA